MLIFYTAEKPVVIVDAMSSDDRFTSSQIAALVNELAPSTVQLSVTASNSSSDTVSVKGVAIYSCEYSCEFAHIGIPLGQGMKTRFSAMLKSAPTTLVTAFSPVFLTSSKSLEEMADAAGKIANPQTTLVYGAMVIQGQAGNVKRRFIAYAAPIEPDPMGTTTTMFVAGATIDDILIKSECAFQLKKSLTLSAQLDELLASNGYTGTYKAPQASSPPATNILFRPMKFNALIDEICLQNKMIPMINTDKMNITFSATDPTGAPAPTNNAPSFSFLGYKGFMAWGLGVENYANIKMKTAMFDPELFQTVTIYNDIKSAFFNGLTKVPSPGPATAFAETVDKYSAFVIRYILKWNRAESLVELTASANWLMAMFRVDGLLESSIFTAALK